MSAKKSGSKTQAKAHPLVKPLESQLTAAILPGDAALDDDALEDIAGFLLEAAEKRGSFALCPED